MPIKTEMVSVIIPTYKRNDQLIKAVSSVLAQTCTAIEIIIVDDDQENTGINFKDPRITYLKNERQKGGNGSRNTGILHSSGQFIAFLDDDDEWLPTKIDDQLKKLNLLDDSWGGCYCGWITDDVEYLVGYEGLLLKKYLKESFDIGASSTLFFKRDALLAVGLWDETLVRHQDLDLLIRFLKVFKLAFVDKPLVIVNGHNIPRYEISKRAKELFFNKLDQLDLPQEEYSHFLANHYRELAVFASIEGRTNEVVVNIKKSARTANIPPSKFFSAIVYLLNFYTLKLKFGRFKNSMRSLYNK